MKTFFARFLILLLAHPLAAQITLTLPASQDAAIGYHEGANTAGNNYGGAIQNAGYMIPSVASAVGSNGNRALIAFNLNAIPAGATLVSAKLNLYALGPFGSVQGHFGATNSCYLRRVVQNWSEYAATWNNQPATVTQNQVILQPSTGSAQNYLNINVTQLVQDMISNPSAGFGFLLGLVTEVNTNGLCFASRDHSNPALHPTLDIVYELCSNQALSLSASPSGVVCAGQPVTLFSSGSGTGSVSWYATSQSTTALASGLSYLLPSSPAYAPGVYTYYAGMSNCLTAPKVPLSVTVHPTPAVTASAGQSVICQGETVLLTAGGAISYTWSNGPVPFSQNPSQLVGPGMTTSYNLAGALNGCTGTAQVQVVVNSCTGLRETNAEAGIPELYPNPAAAAFTVRSAGISFDQLRICDLQGKLVKAYAWPAGKNVCEITDAALSPGLYLCTLLQGGKALAVKKLVVPE